MKNVFAFTFKQHIKNKSFYISTVVIALLCLLLPFIIITLLAFGETSENEIENVYIADLIEGEACDYSFINKIEGFENVSFSVKDSLEEALKEASGHASSVVICLSEDQTIEVTAIIPDSSFVTYENAETLAEHIRDNKDIIMSEKLGLPSLMHGAPTVSSASPEETDENTLAREILSVVLMFVMIMLLYFMILFYGQSVSSSLVSEKSSKLSETLLVSVKPINIVFGKLFSIALSGILQIFIWIACFAGSFLAGALAAKAINPDTTMLPVVILDSLKAIFGVFSAGTIIFTLLTIVCGFIMYCSLAAICGAMASKSEDLSATNSIFSLILVISFLTVIYKSVPGSEVPIWMSVIPFTGMLINPGLLVAGKLSFTASLVCLGLTLAFALFLMYIASKLYRALIFYRGAPLSPAKIFAMLKKDRTES